MVAKVFYPPSAWNSKSVKLGKKSVKTAIDN
jgi:hypothetical protein